MRKVCVFLLLVLGISSQMIKVSAHQVIHTKERSVLAYEVLDVKITPSELRIEGWGILPDKHHFIGEQSHQYFLELQSQSHKLEFKGSLKATDLSKIMEYRGYGRCSSSSLNQTNCNYDFKNVGFIFIVPLNQLKTNHQYQASFKIKSTPLNVTYQSDLYYPKDHAVEKIHLDRNIVVQSHYQTMHLQAYYHTLAARTAPGLSAPELKVGASCSSGYENRAYFQKDSLFKQIKGIEKHQELITYFKVHVKDAGCFDLRRRVNEGTFNDQIAYIPSIYVNYHGAALKIKVAQIYHDPVIQAENQSLMQFTPYEALDYAKASDKKDGDISHQLKVTYDNVNSFQPGQYTSCFSVKNSLDRKTSKCIKVDVIKAYTFYRYVNKTSIHILTENSQLWSHQKLKALLENILNH